MAWSLRKRLLTLRFFWGDLVLDLGLASTGLRLGRGVLEQKQCVNRMWARLARGGRGREISGRCCFG